MGNIRFGINQIGTVLPAGTIPVNCLWEGDPTGAGCVGIQTLTPTRQPKPPLANTEPVKLPPVPASAPGTAAQPGTTATPAEGTILGFPKKTVLVVAAIGAALYFMSQSGGEVKTK